MRTLQIFSRRFDSVPAAASWYLSDLGEARGKQELFTRQSPQRLKVLREHALIESAVSSNRIEGVEVDKSRIATIVFGKPLLRNRDEEEVRGYRQALALIHEQGAKLNFLLSIIKMAYQEFEERLGQIKSPRGAKTDMIEKTIQKFSSEFSLGDLERTCPSVSRDMIRRVLRNLQAKGDVECLGRGPGALWRKREKR